MSRMKTLDLGQLVVGIFVRAWRHGINEMRFTWVPGGLSDLAAKRRESGVGSQVKRFFFVCTLPSTVPHTIARARFSAAWDERGPVAQQDRAGCNSHNPGAGVDPEAQGRTVKIRSCQEFLLAGVASELSFFPLMGLGGRSGGNNKTYRIGNDMAAADYKLCDVCSGKAFYDANLIYEDQRDAEGRTPYKVAGKPSDWGYCLGYLGDWAVLCDDCAKTHQTRIIEAKDASAVDAAPDLLAALLAMLEYTASVNANQGFGDEDDHEAVKLAAAAVLKATGGAS